MNKSELVSKMTELAGVTKVQAEKGLSVLIQAITEAVEKGSAIRLRKNPRTGEPLKIASKKVVKFRAGKKLNEVVLKG
jgi:DNA-binding protein HU-beta